MDTPPPAPIDWRQRLRETRRRELAPSEPSGRGLPTPDEHRVSLTQVHDSVLGVLARIDAAEDAMRSVLRAWAQDPARGGAHLLGGASEAPAAAPDETPPTVTWPASPAADPDLAHTIRMPHAASDSTEGPTIPLDP